MFAKTLTKSPFFTLLRLVKGQADPFIQLHFATALPITFLTYHFQLNSNPKTADIQKKRSKIRMDSVPVMNALVHQYLLGVDKKLANMLKKNIKEDLPDLPKDMPSLSDMVTSFQVQGQPLLNHLTSKFFGITRTGFCDPSCKLFKEQRPGFLDFSGTILDKHLIFPLTEIKFLCNFW